jgi:hypothetical protein
MNYLAWTDDLPERESIHLARGGSAAAAEAYAMARVDDIDGQTIYVENADGDVRRFVVVAGVATLQE